MNNNQMGVIFDLDGVLVDSYRAHFKNWEHLAPEFGVSMTERQFAASFGRTSREMIHDLWGHRLSPEQMAAMAERKEMLYLDLLERNFPAMDGALELIDRLLDQNFLLAVGSSASPEIVGLSLRKLGRQVNFKAVVTDEDVGRGKPDPQVFLEAARKMKLAPSACAVIEDAPPGVSAGRAGGMAVIAKVGTAPAEKLGQADLVVNSLRDLTPERIAELIQAKRDPIYLSVDEHKNQRR